MPIEIRELQIKATVSDNGSGDTAGDLIRFGDPVPDAWNGKGAPWDDASLPDRCHPVPLEDQADPPLRGASHHTVAQGAHSGGVNMTWGDGSMHFAPDGLDLFS
jgi:prepilin-type processing-associated H-X9-DG protein